MHANVRPVLSRGARRAELNRVPIIERYLSMEASILTDDHYDETLDGADGLVDGEIESRIARAFSRAMLRANVRRGIVLGILCVGDDGICAPIRLASARHIVIAERRDNGFADAPQGQADRLDETALVLARRLNWGILRGWLSLASEHAVLD